MEFSKYRDFYWTLLRKAKTDTYQFIKDLKRDFALIVIAGLVGGYRVGFKVEFAMVTTTVVALGILICVVFLGNLLLAPARINEEKEELIKSLKEKTIKGVILDFIRPFKVTITGSQLIEDCIPDFLELMTNLVIENKDESTHLLQEINAKLDGLEVAGWTSGSCRVNEDDKALRLPKSLTPLIKLPISLYIRIGFKTRVAEGFIEEFCRLKNNQQKIIIKYTVREGDKTNTKILEEGGINFYNLYCPGYESFLRSCTGSEKAKRLLEILHEC